MKSALEGRREPWLARACSAPSESYFCLLRFVQDLKQARKRLLAPQAEKDRVTHRRHGIVTPAGSGIWSITRRRMRWPPGGPRTTGIWPLWCSASVNIGSKR